MTGDVSLQKSLNVRGLETRDSQETRSLDLFERDGIYSVTTGNSKSGGGTGRRTDKSAVGVCRLAVQSARLLAAVRFKIRGKTVGPLGRCSPMRRRKMIGNTLWSTTRHERNKAQTAGLGRRSIAKNNTT
jgi:hypothetical protein